jgi:long-chain acyl-CoA synthetase
MSLGILEDCVCIPSQHRVLGTVLKLLVVLPSGIVLDKRTLARALQSKLESYKIPMLYEQVPSVRRTFNGKIDRKAYLSQ